jgi:hypothetical protein
MDPAVNLFYKERLPVNTLQTVRRIAFGREEDLA